MTSVKAIAHLNGLTEDLINNCYLLPDISGTWHEDDLFRRPESREIATENVNGKTFVKFFHGYSARPELQGKYDQSYKVSVARVVTLAALTLQLRESGNKKQRKPGTCGTAGTCGTVGTCRTAGTEYRQNMKIFRKQQEEN
ncbi:MAG: hypothetical protein LBB90_06435 [Tannerella sp.]|jgi:hypothetical protein|nr:hypothetical protein [Tannerella sp.]